MEYCEPWCGYWKLNPGFSGRTASVSTVELSVQPLNYFFKALNFKFKELMDFFKVKCYAIFIMLFEKVVHFCETDHYILKVSSFL